ncbi:hypothetical protein RUND412_001702, partial [Rhizina undulata]
MSTRPSLRNACALLRAPRRPPFPTRPRCAPASILHRPTRSPATTRRRFSEATVIRAPGTWNESRRKLMEGLRRLSKTPWGNVGRLQLALRSLEVEDVVVRIAVLGERPGRLVAALLADPLEGDEAWVGVLMELESEDTGGVLVRYGPETETKRPPGSPIRILEVPAEALKRHRMEILVAPMSAGAKDLRVITLQATKISGARIIQYPVHKTLVYAGEGAKGLQTLLFGGFTNGGGDVVCKALSFPGMPADLNTGNVKITDLPLAEDALKQFKASTANAPVYEKEWLKSGVEQLRQWIFSGTEIPDGHDVKPAVKNFVADILDESEALLNEEKRIKAILPTPPSELTTAAADDLETLSEAVTDWSLAAHTELRDTLDAGFKGKTWRKLAWWKLLWAIDDVSVNSRAVVRDYFLPAARRELLFLAGRVHGAGFRGDLTSTLLLFSPETEESEDETRLDYKYPPDLIKSRTLIFKSLIPGLQSAANKLLFKAGSTSGLCFALTGLLYASDVELYSALSVAALGTVGSLRWLQKRWEKEERRFREGVGEMGRRGIVGSERWLWGRLRAGVEEKVTAESEVE